MDAFSSSGAHFNSHQAFHYLMTYVTSDDLLMMVILCGQEELAARIERYPEIKSRMYPSALSALTREEVEEVIRYRWKVAGTVNSNLPFQKEALDAIFDYSKGLPREVCKICDMALLHALAAQKKMIDAGIIRSVSEGLKLTGGNYGKR